MKYFKWIIALVVGAAGGLAYWYFIGCNSGSCAITSSPINSSIYGAIMGWLILTTVATDRKNKSHEQNNK